MSTIRCNVASRTAVRPAAARKPMTIVAQANKAQKVNIAQTAAAVATTFALFAAPVFAGEVDTNTIRAKICSANPTAKICVKNSFVVSDAPAKGQK